MSIENKLTYLEGTKTAIKDAIVAKGVAIDDNATFRSYATAISTIETGGGTEINNQTKTVEINQNGQTTVSYDEGYTGLESVVINTNVESSGSGDDPFLVLGYPTPDVVKSDINYSLDIKNNWDMSLTQINFDSDTKLKYFPFVDTKNITNMSNSKNFICHIPTIRTKPNIIIFFHYFNYTLRTHITRTKSGNCIRHRI